jgi:hypothetical protein
MQQLLVFELLKNSPKIVGMKIRRRAAWKFPLWFGLVDDLSTKFLAGLIYCKTGFQPNFKTTFRVSYFLEEKTDEIPSTVPSITFPFLFLQIVKFFVYIWQMLPTTLTYLFRTMQARFAMSSSKVHI